jgi:hypothetical protein
MSMGTVEHGIALRDWKVVREIYSKSGFTWLEAPPPVRGGPDNRPYQITKHEFTWRV